ncbi:uncharacterized protein lrrc53 [Spinachia spinachia]
MTYAPDTTQALLLTEGSIAAVQSTSLSDLSNVSVIGLSHNLISALGEQSFRNLPFLHTLLLDHNLLASQALQGGALTNLTRLEVLALGHNLISMSPRSGESGSVRKPDRSSAYKQVSSLSKCIVKSPQFPIISNIRFCDPSFGGLVRLQTLDLSRNRLRSAPAEAFSYLSWLTNLNLDLNSWNCSCQLLELAAFLTTFIQQPDKVRNIRLLKSYTSPCCTQTLYNGQRMVCVSANNPAVTTALELTEANCVPSNQNITVRIEARGSVTPQRYAQDLAITAVICFSGGVCLTLLVVLIVYQVSRSKKLKESKRQKVEEEVSSRTVENHHACHRDVGEMRRELFWQAHRSPPWDRESMTIDAWTGGHGGQFESRTEGDEHFKDCMGPKPLRWNDRIHGKTETEEERETRGMRRTMMVEKRRLEHGINGRDIQDMGLPRSNANSSSHPRKEAFAQRPEALAHETNVETKGSYRTDMEGRSREHETVPCENCHRMTRPPEQNRRQGRPYFEGVHPQYRQIGRGRNVNHNEYDMLKSTDLRRETRNVTFDLESSRSLRCKRDEEVRSYREKERGKRHKAEVQSSRSPMVKLNLNPLGKIQVHPKNKTELGHPEKVPSKRSKDKRQDAEDRGEREAIAWPGKKTKDKTLNKGPNEDREGKDKPEDTGEGGQESKRFFEQEQRGQGNVEDSHHDDAANTLHPSASVLPFGQGQMLQGERIQFQGAGIVLGSAQLSSQHTISISGQNQTDNLSLFGSTSSQPTGSSLSLQGGNFQVPGSLIPTGPAQSVAPIAISEPHMTASGAIDSVRKQPVFGSTSPDTSHLANTVYMNTLQTSAMQNSPLPTSQAAGVALSLNLPVDSAPVQSLLQSKTPPDSSPLVARWETDPVPASGLSQCHSLPTQAPLSGDGLSTETPLAPGPKTTVESLSNNNSPTETRPTVQSAAEGPAAELSGGSMQGAAVSVSDASAPSVSTHSVSSTGDAAAAVLQQEYLSEDGGSSPRRKLRLVLPEKTSSRPPTALERKIR